VTSWNLADLFESVADAVPDREACVAGATRLSYCALDDRANRLAHVLAGRGVRSGDCIAVALRNCPEYLETMLAAFKLRAVPINVNVRYTADELRYLINDAGATFVVHERDVVDQTLAAAPDLAAEHRLLCRGDEYETALTSSNAERPTIERSGDDRYILYTGGTTGMPKGVVWRHEDLFFAALGGAYAVGEPITAPTDIARRAPLGRARCLPASPFTHGTAHWMALTTLLQGGTVVLVVHAPTFVAECVWDTVAAEEVTVLVIVGDAFGRPLADALDQAPDRWDLDRLLVVVSGGATLCPAVRHDLLRHLPGAVLVDGYGTSETGGQGLMPVWPGQTSSALPRFNVDADTAVLDHAGRPVAPGSGQTGRLARRGRLPLGYHGDPERTASTFPVIDGVRWAIPGDLGRVEEDGSVTLLGRGGSSINSGGEKVFPDEVEAVLRAHADVFDAIVVGVPDPRWGQAVTAVVVLRPDRSTDPNELIAHCRAQLARFKAPRRVVLVADLHRKPSGKPDLAWAEAVAARRR